MKCGKSDPISNKGNIYLLLSIFKDHLNLKTKYIHCRTQQSLPSEPAKHLEDNLVIKKNMKVFARKYSLSIAMQQLEVRERGLVFGCLLRAGTGLSRPPRKALEWRCSKGKAGVG